MPKIITKIKRLIQDNTLIITQDNQNIQIIITNKNTGNSHLVAEKNWTLVIKKAIDDTYALSGNRTFNF